MNSQNFLKIYHPDKINKIASVQVINDIVGERNNYYEIEISTQEIHLNFQFKKWTREYFAHQLNEVGIMYAEVFVHNGSTQDFTCLDEFMHYINIREIEKIPENIFSFNKTVLSKDEFDFFQSLYWDEHFMNSKGNLVNIDYSSYEEGFIYLDEPSVKQMGCSLVKEYWAFTYNPYI